MQIKDILEKARADMQDEVDRRVGPGVRVLLIDEQGRFSGHAFLTKRIEVKAAVARGDRVAYVASATPITGLPEPVLIDFIDLEDIQVGFKLKAEHGHSWEVRTEDYLTTHNKQLLGILDNHSD